MRQRQRRKSDEGRTTERNEGKWAHDELPSALLLLVGAVSNSPTFLRVCVCRGSHPFFSLFFVSFVVTIGVHVCGEKGVGAAFALYVRFSPSLWQYPSGATAQRSTAPTTHDIRQGRKPGRGKKKKGEDSLCVCRFSQCVFFSADRQT